MANTAIGAVSFLALEAIGGSITVNYGFLNATSAILVVGALIFLTCIPIAYYAATYGIDIDLLTRGAGFGYIGSTITSLIYASFTFLFFAIEAAIMSLALEMCFGVPLFAGYVLSSLIVIPLVTHGITFISRLQLWTQPVWIVLHLLPFAFIAFADIGSFERWTGFSGTAGADGQSFNLILFGTAATVVFSLIAQIGEQVDFLRFLPPRDKHGASWWAAYLSAGPGWIIPGVLKMLAGSFLAFLAIEHLVPPEKAAEPTQMYLVGFQYVFSSPQLALAFTGAFVIISQIKINVTNAYAGSLAWSNFFSRLTHSHPGRVVWLVFNVAIALMLMELGIFKMLEHILGLYSIVAVAWVGALVADLAINKPLGLSPAGIEFKRAHLYDINPVGVGAMLAATIAGIVAFVGVLGTTLQSLSAFLALAVAFVMAPAIAYVTKSRFYIARAPRQNWSGQTVVQCAICEHPFETEDMAHCPPIPGRSARCAARSKPAAGIAASRRPASRRRRSALLERILPNWVIRPLNTDVGRYLGVLLLFGGVIGSVLSLVYFQVSLDSDAPKELLKSSLWTVFFILTIIAGVAAWLFVLAQDSRRVAEEETRRQTDLLMNEIEAHKRTDAKLQQAKEVAEAASKAKSRHVVGLSHELRTPLNAILGYAQLLERDPALPTHRVDAVKVVRRSAEHLSGLIDGLLDISKIEAGRFHLDRNEVHTADFLDQIVDMFRLQATAKGIEFRLRALETPASRGAHRREQVAANPDQSPVERDQVHGFRPSRLCGQLPQSGRRIRHRGYRRRHPQERPGAHLSPVRTRPHGARQSDHRDRPRPDDHQAPDQCHGRRPHGLSEVGKGSCFRVKLLLSEVSRPRIASTKEDRVRGYAGPRQTILVVDDNEIQRDLVRELLTPLGFDMLSATNGRECLTLAERHRPNLILLDIAMPEMDGWQVAQRLRRASRDRAAIVMLSANAIDPNRLLERRTALRRLSDEADRSAPAAQEDPCAAEYRVDVRGRERASVRAGDDRCPRSALLPATTSMN